LQQPSLPVLDNKQLLIECLKHSPISLVSIESQLGYGAIKFWAEACQAANKPIYLSPSIQKIRPKSSHQFVNFMQSIIDWILALILFILLSPLMLGLVIMMWLSSSAPLFSYQWQVGKNGKIFQAINFSTNIRPHQNTVLSLLMGKYGWARLPLLFNVLRGEIRFIGYNCCSLEDATNLSIAGEQEQLNELAEVISFWQIKAKFKPAR
jgi:lipopolysaccharide/colanic/teichoic acid biosynthesis glycosyltransferase